MATFPRQQACAFFVESGNNFTINRTATFKHLLAVPFAKEIVMCK